MDSTAAFTRSCEHGCAQNNEADFCSRFCACATQQLIEQDLLQAFLTEGQAAQSRPEVQEIARLCTERVLKAPESD